MTPPELTVERIAELQEKWLAAGTVDQARLDIMRELLPHLDEWSLEDFFGTATGEEPTVYEAAYVMLALLKE